MILQVRDENGNWINIPAIQGPEGPQGPSGELTEEEKAQLLEGYATMEEVEAKGYQTANDVATAISNALSAIGVAEEGVY